MFCHDLVVKTLPSREADITRERGFAAVNTRDPEEQAEVEKGVSAPTQKNTKDGQRIIKAVLLALFLIASLAVVHLSPLRHYLNPSQFHMLQDKLAQFRLWAPMVFFIGSALLITIGSPRSVISIFGGIVFGFFWGVLLSLAAALLGSIVIFLLTKRLGRPLFRRRIDNYLKAIEDYVSTEGLLIVVLLRQLPLTCILVNVLIGLTPISTGVFLLGSILGLLPECIIFALFGSSVQSHFILRVVIASFLLVILAVAVRLYYRKSPIAKNLSQKLSKP